MYKYTYNRRVKFGINIPNHFGKMSENLGRGVTPTVKAY